MPHSICILGDSTMLFLDWETVSYLEVNNITPGWHEITVTFDLDNVTSEFIFDGASAGLMSTPFGASYGFGGVYFGAEAYNPFTGQEPPGAFYIDDLNLVDELFTIGLDNLGSSVLKVVPNPSNGSFSVDLSGVMLSKAKLTLMDMTGTIVFSENIASDVSIQNIESRLGSGMYILKIADSQQEWIEKIVIK